jgi:DNA polymerase elongation subunit (family B)
METIAKYNYIPVSNDTDSISFRKPDGSPFTDQEQQELIDEINALMPSKIEFEHDGYFETVLVVKAKNYIMRDYNGKVKYKGSSIKDQKKEPALREMLGELILDLMDTNGKNLKDIYHKYIKEAMDIQDINRWSVKKSISDKVLNPSRKNEQVILDAVKHRNPREGDKFYLYTALDGERQSISKGEPVFLKNGSPKMEPNNILKCVEDWSGDEYKEHYVKRVYMTLSILENLIDLDEFVKYHNKSNHKKLQELIKS